jgi:nucleoside-diphosphate-sugar epimerase
MPTESHEDASLTVLVTGATGFVGLHTAAALHAAGHRLRALVRSPEKARRVFAMPLGADGQRPLAGSDRVEIVSGDITDPASIDRALAGCDAVLHSAAMVSVHARDAAAVVRTNVAGARNVLGAAAERGIERLVHVSSTTALFRPDARRVDESSPLGDATQGYAGSKIACEHAVRALQARGAPIRITYPASVIGPDDPGLSEAMAGIKAILDSRTVAITTSGIQLVDVRDLALVHRLLLERDGPADRFLVGGHYLTWTELADALETVTGKRFLRLPVPTAGVRLFGELMDWIGRFVDVEMPMSAESSRYATDWAVADDRHVRETLGISWRPVEDSLRDAVAALEERDR